MRNFKCDFTATIMIISLTALLLYGCSTNEASDASGEAGDTQDISDGEASPGAEADSGGKEAVTIKFWHTYGDTEEKAFLDVVMPMWNELHPNIKVDAVRQDSGNYHQMIVTGFGTGDVPDVARIDIVNTASYAAQGGLVALDGFEDFTSVSGECLEGPLSTNLYRGHYYGLPLDTNCKAAVVNLDKLKEIGLSGAPATMEEFISAAEGYGKPLLSVSGVGDWDLYPYFWLFGGKLTDDAYTAATGYLNSEASIKAMNTIVDLHNRKILTIRDADGTADAWDGISSGEFAMFFEGPWYFSSYEASEASGIVPAAIPTYAGKTASVVGGENITVFSTSKNQEAAYLFAKFMLSGEVQLAMLETGQLPVLKSLVENEAIVSDPVWSIYMKQMETAIARTPSPNHNAIGEIWSDAMTNIFTAGADVTEELNNAAALIDEQLK